MELDTTLFDLANRCQDAFRECLGLPELAKDNWIENKFGDFNLWVANLHVRSKGHASLDYRLREREDIKDVVRVLLETLIDSLHHCRRAAEAVTERPQNRVPEDLGTESDNSDSSLSSLSSVWETEKIELSRRDLSNEPSRLWKEAGSATTALDQLIRLGVAIRKSGTRFRHLKADQSLNKRDYAEFEQHLTFLLLYGVREHRLMARVLLLIYGQVISPAVGVVLKSMIINPTRLTLVQQRVIHANIVRRNRLDFLRKRGQVLDIPNFEEGLLKKPSTPLKPKNTTPTISHSVLPSETRNLDSSTVQMPQGSSTFMTATDMATSFMFPETPPKKAMTQVTRVSATGLRLDYPKGPGDMNGRKTFQCPYCLHMLPERYAKTGWKAHVQQDILPYVCIFEECSTPDQLYSSKEEWLGHMRTLHSAQFWKCPYPQTSKFCFESRFVTEQEWIVHVKENHKSNGGAISESQLQTLAGFNVTSELSIGHCPLCGFLDAEDQMGTVDHIAQHLHSFSLKALPGVGFSDEESKASLESCDRLSFADSLDASTSSDDSSSQQSQIWRTISLFRERLSTIIDKSNNQGADLEGIAGSLLSSLQKWCSALPGDVEDRFIMIEKDDVDLASKIHSCVIDIISGFDEFERYCADNPHWPPMREKFQILRIQLHDSMEDLVAQQKSILAFETDGQKGNETEITLIPKTTPSHRDYTIAWICALSLEMAAARVMLDEVHRPLPTPATDPNAYILGNLNGHNIVIACLPAGIYGTSSAATIIPHLMSTFPRVQYALMVGIGGGVPNSRNDIRLGDVVVSKPVGKYSGVIQYDYGKTVQGERIEQTSMLNSPPKILLTYMAYLQANQITKSEDLISTIISDVLERNPNMKIGFTRPNLNTDYLFRSSYHHVYSDNDCEKCDQQQLLYRQPRNNTTPHIHYGLIASGNRVLKDSETRDLLAQQLGILCFEIEAAGFMNQLPTLVVRGICDYCDSHKQKKWQGYAALTAAAYAKLLLSVIPVGSMDVDLMESKKKPQHWMVSLPRNPNFVGRHDEIAILEELITKQNGPRNIAITGLGGVGKTQVALELAHRIHGQDKECSVFWIPCTSYTIIEQTFLQIAQLLGLRTVNPANVKEQVKIYLSTEHAGKWLLIFDNADNIEMWLAASHTDLPLQNFLPESRQGHIIFTSRNRKLAMKLAPFNIVPIPDVDKTIAGKILEKTLAHEDLLRDSTASATLLQQLAFLPLAITQASAYIIQNGINLSTYISLLQNQEEEMVELLSEDFEDPGRYKDIQNPVITTLLISFNQIQHQDQLAADYLFFMACIDPRNIPQSLLPQAAASRKQTIDALALLSAYSFINSQDMVINMHRIVHIAIRSWLRKNALFSHWITNVANHILNIFPDNHHTKEGLEYLPHALALMHENEFMAQENHYTSLINKVADCLTSDGRYQEATIFYERLLRINQEKAGTKHIDTLTSMTNLASTYMNQGRWNDAEYLNIQVMETRKTILGAEHPDTLTSMANLASIYMNQGRWNDAEYLNIQVMETRKTILGAEHPDTLTSMDSLAHTWKSQEKLQDALTVIKECSEMRYKVLGPHHPDSRSSSRTLSDWMDEHTALTDQKLPNEEREKFQQDQQL